MSDSEYESSELRIDLGEEDEEEGNEDVDHDDEDEQIYIDDEADDGESRTEDLDSDLSSLHGSDKRKYKEFDEESVSSLNDMGVNLLKKLKYKFDSTYEDSSSCDTNATSNGKGLPILKSMLSPIDQTSEKIGKSIPCQLDVAVFLFVVDVTFYVCVSMSDSKFSQREPFVERHVGRHVVTITRQVREGLEGVSCEFGWHCFPSFPIFINLPPDTLIDKSKAVPGRGDRVGLCASSNS